MISTRIRKFAGTRLAMIGLTVFACAGAGVAAAAATDSAPWQHPTADAPIVTDATTIPPTAPPTSGEATTEPTTSAAPTTTEHHEVTTTTEHHDVTTTTERHEPTTTAAPEPTIAPPTTVKGPDEPTTTEVHPATTDTPVPLGIALTCTLDGHTVHCVWQGDIVDGFHRFVLLRGDGKVGRVPFSSEDPTAHEYSDIDVPAGSYSYVVDELDGNDKVLVHSNPQFVTVANAG